MMRQQILSCESRICEAIEEIRKLYIISVETKEKVLRNME